MKIIDRFDKQIVTDGVVLAVGLFDGVHLGHKAVLTDAVRSAKRQNCKAWVITFDPHPRDFFTKNSSPFLLTTLSRRITLFERIGFDGCFVIPFCDAVASQSPRDFIKLLTGVFPSLKSVHSGENWTFGAGAAGTTETLKEYGKEFGFAVNISTRVSYLDEPVSSTRIRKAVADGDLFSAAKMLGSAYSVTGTVISGRHLGAANGFATANIQPDSRLLLPKNGVYAVASVIDGRFVSGIADLGFRPTFPDARPDVPILEVHYLNYSGNLYGRELTVSFVRFIRDEIKFESPDLLFKQINKDIDIIKTIDYSELNY